MTPYYDDAGVTIYHADCRGLLDGFPQEMAVVTDPPYGCNLLEKAGLLGSHKSQTGIRGRQYAPVIGDDQPFDPGPLLRFRTVMLFGANWFASRLPDSGAWLVWDKRDGTQPNNMADAELVWTSLKQPVRLYSHRWMGMIRASEKSSTSRVHPTQKPLSLMRWVLSFCPPGLPILDPYMGSGTTLRAAKDCGRRAIGIEIDERYCEIAATRMAQGALDFGEAV